MEELDRELHVADASAALLHVRVVGAGLDRSPLDASLERLDAADVGPGEPAAEDPGFEVGDQPPAQGLIARDAAGLHPGLPLPGSPLPVEILEHCLTRERGRPGRPVGPQSEIDPMAGSMARGRGDKSHRLLDHAVEKLLIRASPRPGHPAISRMDEHEIDVARVIQFAAPELAERDHGDRGRTPVGTAGRAPLPFHDRHGRAQGRLDHAVGHVGELSRHDLEPVCGHDVAVGDPQRLAAFESSERREHGVGIGAAADLGGEGRGEGFLLLGPPAAHPHLLPGLGIGDHDLRQVRTG